MPVVHDPRTDPRGLVNTDLEISYFGLYPILLKLGCMYAAGASAMPHVMAGGKREIGNRAMALGIICQWVQGSVKALRR